MAMKTWLLWVRSVRVGDLARLVNRVRFQLLRFDDKLLPNNRHLRPTRCNHHGLVQLLSARLDQRRRRSSLRLFNARLEKADTTVIRVLGRTVKDAVQVLLSAVQRE